MLLPEADDVMMPPKFAIPNCAPLTAFNWPAIVVEAFTASEPVVVALPFMVVEPTETKPALKVMVVDVALFGNGYANTFAGVK